MSFSRLLLRAVFNNLHGRSRDDLPLPDSAGIETRSPTCEHHPSSGSGRQAI
jgi:hypothetical protein